ncbi:glutathione S-transferase [Lindgomyces ingoldianus]|uniref:Glutathione S-transferase n=1 Tax=Lindgomyces ingoldianus TaxID=673940 RepID=A0ACB6Q7T6_9PLEO|nr:glutathione S-transferase [Lindgomyces ingoldianus]KAF2462885.1 glutathione S-transferase [Lindgomyces ingoldianus]
MRPITLYSAPGGPNPFKVVIICEELGIPYDLKVVGYGALKEKPFTDLNPNGRCPAIEDPNTGIVLWESGAIITYLVEQYDTEKKLHYDSFPEKHFLNQWMCFQISGQGPYFGQAAWFNLFHPEKLPSAQQRYMDEVHRVVGVLDGALASGPSGWLVGEKCTYADLIFVMWHEQIARIFAAFQDKWDIEKYPEYKRWIESMKNRQSIKKAVEMQQKILADATK